MKLRWLPEAAEDLQQIHDYFGASSPDVAFRMATEIYDAILALRNTPYMGRSNPTRDTRDLILPRIRYKATYRIRNETVEVLYIRHSSRDPRNN